MSTSQLAKTNHYYLPTGRQHCNMATLLTAFGVLFLATNHIPALKGAFINTMGKQNLEIRLIFNEFSSVTLDCSCSLKK